MRIPLGMLNRHGLVAGATGTGKTKTLQVLAEQVAAQGVPVFAADIKGDLSGIATPASRTRSSPRAARASARTGSRSRRRPSTSRSAGSARASRSARRSTRSGRCCCRRCSGLNETQESSLSLVFHYAREAKQPLVDLGDLRSVLTYLTGTGKEELKELGGLSAATAGVILRELIAFADEGADVFFGQPEIDDVRLPAHHPRRQGHRVAAGGAERPGQAGAVLDVPDVPAQPAVPRAARGRRHRQAQAGVLLRRGPPAVQGRVEGLPRAGRADRPAHPVQGRRHLLRHPDAQGRAHRRAGAARLARAAPAARPHTRRRQGAQGHRVHVPELPATTSTRCSPSCRSARPSSRS